MRQIGFDKQLLRVFTFIVSLSVLVSLVALGSNWYLSGQQRALIQNNLPALSLARKISDESVFVAALAPSYRLFFREAGFLKFCLKSVVIGPNRKE